MTDLTMSQFASKDDLLAAQAARIAELESQLDAIGAGGVEPLRKPAAQAVHQIAEPAAPVGKPIKDAIDALVMAAFTEGGCSEHRMSEARIQTELRKKELCTLLSTPQPCSRSHPHEEMTPMCELRTEIARLTNALARAEAAAPPAVQAAVPEAIEQMAVDRYKVVPSHESMFHRWAVVAGNGTQQLYIGREGECQNMARKFMGAFLDGAFVAMQNAAPAHPAEGVPAPEAMAVPDWLRQMEWAVSDYDRAGELQSWCPNCGGCKADYRDGRAGHKDSCELAAALAATQPAAQGMDAQLVAFIEKVRDFKAQAVRVGSSDGHVRWDIEYGHYGAEVRAKTLPDAIAKAIAAQAKQGGVDHG